MKKLRIFYSILGLSVCAGFSSCKSIADDIQSDEIICPNFNEQLTSNINIMMNTKIVVDNVDEHSVNSSRSSTLETVSSISTRTTPVVADLECVEYPELIDISAIRTPGQMQEIQTKYGVDFYILEHEPISMQSVILVSDDAALQALMPLIEQCKDYLHTKGFSDDEIEEMVTENNTSIASIVPFVIALTEFDEELDAQSIANYTRSYADRVLIQKGLKCMLKALGSDAIIALTQEWNNLNAQQWTKSAIKLLFKKIAPKLNGVVAFLIFAIEYTSCMHE